MHPYLFPWELSPDVLLRVYQVAAIVLAGFIARGFAVGKDGAFRWGTFVPSFLGLAALGLVLSRRFAPSEPQPLPIHTYGLFIAAAFLCALYVTARESERVASVSPHAYFLPNAPALRAKGAAELGPGKLARKHMMDLIFWIFLGGMGGAWFLYALINRGGWGFVFYGGFLGATLASFLYARKHGLNMRALADVCIPGVALGHFFGRMGCMSAGCCWGKVAENPDFVLGAHFPPESVAFKSMLRDPEFSAYLLEHGTTPALHPTQMYDGVGELALFALLLLLRPRKRFHGQLVATWLMGYAILRLSIETFRGDFGRGMLFRWPEANPLLLSTSQIVGLALLTAGIVAWLRWRPKERPAVQGVPATGGG